MSVTTKHEIMDEAATGGADMLQRAATRMLSVLPHAFKQMMIECKDRIPAELSDIGEAQFWLLFLLAEEDLTMSELARRMQVTPPTVSRMVDSLVGKGLVDRRHDTEDRRITWLSLSARGQEVNRELHRVFQGAVTEFMRPLDEAQLQSVVVALDVLQSLLPDENGAASRRENSWSHNATGSQGRT